MSYAAESELGALFMNAKKGHVIRLTLKELVHLEPSTPMNYDNATAAGTENGSVMRQRSRSMDIRYFYILNKVKNGEFDVSWHPWE